MAREVLERLANPALWDFLIAAKDQGNAWASDTLADLVRRVGLGETAEPAPQLARRRGHLAVVADPD